ncbi:hypothetical protein ACH95_22300 [Bacillus glycinifermentans]|mgnify:CR=1 FL=1|uniref:Phage protein n=1 Tax=Bacillus glycinifermentans TaxID=1664069 RepID=A0A0J6E883_9BACI|nr:hypothetical protein [Bacillus glycinifermentans]ATH95177.1 hypothetical protein COP00_23470 [Bacillus glycinifermentans]KMM52819.1 hypothetical protein ACH95_22300 [Bacillus glycinifermentans]KRT92680.1 hypothetical protein AB447_222435 [Bacillus glycinifermentans]MEC0487976.1 hypothetical protein [Bacillus glycinifermentans]MEC0497288.1 hypothetical protein [Bacillus glycinifermentans]
MEPISITLKIDGKNKKFATPKFIPGKLFRLAAEITEDFESNDPDRLFTEKQIEFICAAFGDKFTLDEFENGIDSRMITRTIYGTANYVLGNIAEASQLLSPDQKKDGEELGE